MKRSVMRRKVKNMHQRRVWNALSGKQQVLKHSTINNWVGDSVSRGQDSEEFPQRSYNEDFLPVMKVRTGGHCHASGTLIPYPVSPDRSNHHLLQDVLPRSDY